MSPPPEQRMFFIVGRGRSGTTLLARLLDAHPALSVARESLFVLYLSGRYADADWSDPATARGFARDLWLEERMRKWPLDPGALERRLAALGPPSFAAACAEVYRAAAAARGKEPLRLGDKNPHHSLFVGELARLFPEARFVFLTRYYPAVIASYREVRFDLSSVAALAERWRLYNRSVLRLARRSPERVRWLRYEELVREPRRSLDAVCRFLGVPFAPEMLDPPDRDAAGFPPWHPNLLRPPEPSLAERWRGRLTARELALADSVCQPLAAHFGYPPAVERGTVPRGRLRVLPGVLWARLVTALERLVFVLPLRLRARLVRLYRISTGNRIG